MRRPLLAVMVAPVGHSVLPVELAGLHILDYTQPTEATAFELVRSISALPPPQPPPRPLPPTPPVPLSYLNALRDQISGPPLDFSGQLSLVARLSDGMRSGDADERHGARELLLALAQRGQLYEQPAQLLRTALANEPAGRTVPPSPPRARQRARGGDQGSPPPQHQPRTPPRQGASKPTKALAWIGGIVLALFVVGIVGAMASSSSGGGSGSSGGGGGGAPTQLTVCRWDQSGHAHPHLFDSATGQPVLQPDGNLTAC